MIILASASPRRKELLNLITEDFKVLPADIDETININISIDKCPEYLATQKAQHIFSNGHNNDTVIGCDTGVFINDKMLGKPHNTDEAKQMLKLLSGKTHKVITGCCVINKSKKISFSQTTKIEFYSLSDDEINNYILSGEPMDKAGAYGIQGKVSLFVKSIIGDYFNVVGLPVSTLNKVLNNFQY